MKLKLKNRKIIFILGGLLAAAALSVAAILLLQGGESEAVQRREYPVQKGDIVVGIEAAGSISSEKQGQFMNTPLQIKQYQVKVGDYVKTGDALAELSGEDITEKLKAANEKLKNDAFAVEKLKTDKQNYQLELEKRIRDIRTAGENVYGEKAGALLSKKAAAQQSIADKQAQIEQLRQSIAGYEAEKNANAGQPTETMQEKTQAEQSLIDYDALIADANAQIARLEAEIAALNAELAAVNDSLKTIDEQRLKDRSKEDEDIALMIKQGQAQHALYDNQISQAQSTYADTKKERDAVLVYQNDPWIRAESDGVILKLVYAPNATTDAVTPVAEIGKDTEKTLLLQLDPVDITQVEIGQEVSFYVDAYAKLAGLLFGKQLRLHRGGRGKPH